MALRHQRDRALLVSTESADLDPARQPNKAQQQQLVLAWWRALQREAEVATQDPPLLGGRLARWFVGGQLLLALAGLLVGLGAALAAFAYDGRFPVNLLAALMLLVGIPGLFLVLSLALLPGRVPGLSWLQDVLASLNIGQWLARWIGKAAHGRRQDGALDNLFGGWQRQRSAASTVGKWLMLRFAQVFTLTFFVGAIATLLALVSFSDLAFGWSTTLQLDPATVVQVVQITAAPWAGFWPDAAPSAQLVLQSQYLRAQGVSDAAPLLGGWWPYVLMCLLLYGLVPRLLLLLVCHWRLRTGVVRLLLEDEQVQLLIARLQTPWVERKVSQPEDTSALLPPVSSSAPLVPSLPSGRYAVLFWNQVVSSSAARVLADVYKLTLVGEPLAFSNRSLGGMADALSAYQSELPDHFLILTKGWEPPLLELHDVLRELASYLAPTGRVLVEPLSLESVAALGDGADTAKPFRQNVLDEVDLGVWQQSIAQLQEPKILLAVGHD